MKTEDWKKLNIQTFGLTEDLFVPIAAASIDAIEEYVGRIEMCLPGRKRAINAVVVEAYRPNRNPHVPLWNESNADGYYLRLHPLRQLWVHVDYAGYRGAWKRLGFGEISSEIFLDHIQNRTAVRLSGYKHPFLRLCPVSRATNTSGGLNKGAEGMEKDSLRNLDRHPDNIQQEIKKVLDAPVVLADPADLTKMLDIPPGLSELQGVASMLRKFYTN